MGYSSIYHSHFGFPMGIKLLRFIFFTIAAVTIMWPSVTHAESIQQNNTDVKLTPDGSAEFHETITYHFDKEKRGIYRDIPYVGKIADGQYLYYDFSLESVTRNGQSERADESTKGSYVRVKIGDANKTISGSQVYDIVYTLSPFVRHDPAGDYLSINLHGTAWDVDASDVGGRIILPAGAKIKSQECFTGAQGSREKNCLITGDNDGSLLVRATQPLGAHEGMTVDLVLEPGAFEESAYLQASSKEPPAYSEDSGKDTVGWMLGLIFMVGMVVYGVVLAVRYFKRRVRRAKETVVAQFDAPKGLSPGEIGLLTDETATTVEVTATLIDLARRGHFVISYEKQKKLFGSKDRFLLTKQSTQDKLSDAEKGLLNGIFMGASEDRVYIDQLQPASMSVVVTTFKKKLQDSLQNSGIFAPKLKLMAAENLTERGYDMWAHVEGLKLYLQVAEKDRMKFAEAPEKTPERFTKLLPYAIALGVEKQWAKQFEGIDVEPATRGWYHGGNGSNSIMFAGLMSNSFASSVSSHFTPPSSSGGAGGGFSGGGGGGGGGGSW